MKRADWTVGNSIFFSFFIEAEKSIVKGEICVTVGKRIKVINPYFST